MSRKPPSTTSTSPRETIMATAAPLYDHLGRDDAWFRRPDARIAGAIRAALGDVRSVLNVGAGAGSYEPRDCNVVAVESSLEMIRQRAPGAAPVIQVSS